jgi:peptidoglycan/LPS O-acetylase OafA/YrhL
MLPDRFDHLNLLRGVAAFLVVIGHARGMLFVDFADVADKSDPLAFAFYFLTALGHQAVICFFALSGFLVGGSFLIATLEGTVSWRDYLLRRSTLLYIVLIPSLLATLAFDLAGSNMGPGYAGEFFTSLWSGPSPEKPPDIGLAAFIGNALFLQTIEAPVYGTNGPLWSLANEAWYYLIFPLLAWSLISQRGARRIAGTLAAIVLLVWLPFEISALGAIWVIGALARWSLESETFLGFWRRWTVRIAILAALASAVMAAKAGKVLGTDLLLGIAVAAALPVLAVWGSPGNLYARVSLWFSEVSYSLYLSHFSMLFFLASVGLGFEQFDLTPGSFMLFVGFCAVAVLWAFLFWLLFERHTRALYRWTKRLTEKR